MWLKWESSQCQWDNQIPNKKEKVQNHLFWSYQCRWLFHYVWRAARPVSNLGMENEVAQQKASAGFVQCSGQRFGLSKRGRSGCSGSWWSRSCKTANKASKRKPKEVLVKRPLLRWAVRIQTLMGKKPFWKSWQPLTLDEWHTSSL